MQAKDQHPEEIMKRSYISIIATLIVLCTTTICYSEVIFSSKWDSPTTGATGTENDGGRWYYAYPGNANVDILRVSGNQSNIGGGGPSGPPSGTNATNYLRIHFKNTGDPQLYLQNASENSSKEYTDLYMGAWWFFETGFQFRDSVKFMDFRGNLSKLATGNGHLALFGFSHESWSAGTTYYGASGYTNGTPGWGSGVHQGPFAYLTTFRYLSGSGTNVSGNEQNFNFHNVSPQFDSNMDTNQLVIPRASYATENVNRPKLSGGKWIAVIVHAKIHTTDGELDMWIKDGTNSLKKVMEWNKNTVWSSDNSAPRNFYTANGTAAINHVQFMAYRNSGSTYPANQYLWLANPVVATTLNEVEDYLFSGRVEAPVLRIQSGQ
jgi:hypothetical protein